MQSWNLLFEKSKQLPQSVRNNYLINGLKNHDDFLVEMALLIGAEVNTPVSGIYPIELLCKLGHNEEIFELLIEKNADATVNNNSPLRLAIEGRYGYLIKPLIRAGADVSVNDNAALRLAISTLNYDLIDFLLIKKAKPNRCYPEIVAVIDRIDVITIDSFIKFGLDLKEYGSRLIIEATRVNRLDIIKLLESNLDISGYIDSLISLAVRTGDANIVQFYVGKCTKVPEEVITIAVKKGYVNTVKVLIDAGVDVTFQDNLPICIAARYGYTAIANMLLKAGADATAHNNEPICNAHKHGYSELEKLLFIHGADLKESV